MKQSHYGKIFLGFILLLTSLSVFASGDAGASLSSNAVTNNTDLSVAYLASVFGNVGSVLHGTSGQMLGHLFLKLNQGVLVVAGLWLGYSIFTIIVRSAMEGSFMGQNKNVALTFLKISLGIAFLVPSPSTGYSLLQTTIMKVVVEGVSLADATWEEGLSYIDNGGSLWHRPEAVSSGSKASGASFSGSQAKPMLKNLSKNIYLSEVCMVASSMKKRLDADDESGSSIFNSGMVTKDFTPQYDDANNVVNFPGRNDSVSDVHANSCGSVSWDSIPNTNNEAQKATAKYAIAGLVGELQPAAKVYVCQDGAYSGLSQCTGVSGTGNDITNAFFGSIISYVNAVFPIAQHANKGRSSMAKGFISHAKKAGWMSAGRYYWDLAQIQAHYENVSNIANYVPSNITKLDSDDAKQKALSDIIDIKTAAANADNYIDSSLAQINNYSGAAHTGDTGASYTGGEHLSSNIILAIILGPVVADIASLILLFTTHIPAVGMGADPIMFLHRVGMAAMAISGDIWIEVGLGVFGILMGTIVCQSAINASTPLTGLADWLKPPLMILAMMFLTIGVMLGYYVPLYPYMLFTFGIIGWIISVIEAMVAAPLVALGLTHPEGHDFLGESKQALMLVLGIFLRPVLMVIGLIAGMILSFVALRILVFSYSGFISDIFYVVKPLGNIDGANGDPLGSSIVAFGNVMLSNLGSLGGMVMSLLALPLFLAFFASLVYVVTNQCFSLIYVLPDYILRWIGGPQTPQGMSAGEMARQVQGTVQQGASQMGSMLKEGRKAKDLDQGKKTEHSAAGGSGSGGGAGGSDDTPSVSSGGGGGGKT